MNLQTAESLPVAHCVTAAASTLSPALGRKVLIEELQALDALDRALSIEEIESFLSAADLSDVTLLPWLHFDESCYRRNVIYSGRHFTALALCWRPGQRTPIHNHRGSGCVVRVISGTASETVYNQSASGAWYPESTQHLNAGATFWSSDLDTHQMLNLGLSDLVTLHFYSPPLSRMELLSIDDTVFTQHSELVDQCKNYWTKQNTPLS